MIGRTVAAAYVSVLAPDRTAQSENDVVALVNTAGSAGNGFLLSAWIWH